MPTLDPPVDALRRYRTRVPVWLAKYQTGQPFPREQFFSSRIFYYPCSSMDGNPLRIFGKAHAAHCFVYVDNYEHFLEDVLQQLSDPNNPSNPTGYDLLPPPTRLFKSDLLPSNWVPDTRLPCSASDRYDGPLGLWTVLVRKSTYGPEHGPERLSILHIQWDATTTFEALFCQAGNKLPYAVLLEPYYGGGFHGGDTCPLWMRVVAKGSTPPKWLVVGTDTYVEPWPGYAFRSVARVDSAGHPGRDLYMRKPH